MSLCLLVLLFLLELYLLMFRSNGNIYGNLTFIRVSISFHCCLPVSRFFVPGSCEAPVMSGLLKEAQMRSMRRT